MKKLYAIRGGAGGGYGNGDCFHCLMISNSQDHAMETAREFAYDECLSYGVADDFIEVYEDENDGAYPDEWEIEQEIESWMEYSAEALTEKGLLKLYEDGEISKDDYRLYRIFFDPNKVEVKIDGYVYYIDEQLYKVIMKNSILA